MRLIRHIDQWHDASASVVTIGNFDGVHLGHQAMLNQLVEIAKKRSLRAVNEDFERTFNVVMAKRSSSYTVPARGAQGTVIGPKS